MRTEGDTAYYEFEVREVFDGDIGATTVVSSSTQSAACGRSFNLGTEYIVFASRHDTKNAPWSVESCSATTESTNTRTRDAAITAFGQPQQPDPQAHPIGLDDVGTPLWQQLAIAAAAIAVVATLSRFVVRAVRSKRTDL